MNSCLTDCSCPEGGCEMDMCMHNCNNGGVDVAPPLCLSVKELAPLARGGLTPSAVCKRDHGEVNALTPYVCDEGAGYACCDVDSETINFAGMDLGTCTKDLIIQGVENARVVKPPGGVSGIHYLMEISIAFIFLAIPLLM